MIILGRVKDEVRKVLSWFKSNNENDGADYNRPFE